MERTLEASELWGLVDSGGVALDEHLAQHPEDRERVDELMGGIQLARLAAAADSKPLPERIGDYRIEREIGRGSGGVVYEAWQVRTERRVALKVLREIDLIDPAALGRFEREARALGKLAHPHIATIFEAGRTDEGRPFFAMELVHGEPLDRFARSMPLRERVQLFRAVCEAVQHAHREGVIHRDLKPSNVLVDRERGPKVVDFGLARLRDVAIGGSRGEAVLGTLGYVSPEQVRGDVEVDERTDVYSLGVMLYQLLTGALPVEIGVRHSLEEFRRVADKAPTPPRAHVRSLDRDLETIALKALEKDREQRYSSAAALSEDLGCWLRGRPILARRPSWLRKTRLALSQHLVAIGVLSMIAITVLGVLVTVALRPKLLSMSGSWYAEVSPFDALRWEGERPQIEVGGRWHELLSVDGISTPYLIGFCKQEASELWRKRFSEDLLQVLNLMGDWPVFGVDLELRDVETGAFARLERVPLTSAKRRAVWQDRNSWPLEQVGRTRVQLDGREWEVASIDGRQIEALKSSSGWMDRLDYDRYCEAFGRSPGERVSFELRDPSTGETRTLSQIERRVRLTSTGTP